MSSNFVTFQKFTNENLAKGLMELLSEHHIQFEYEDTTKYFDPSFAYDKVNADYIIRLSPADFEKATHLLETYYSGTIAAIEKDYYLYNFSNAELMEIIRKPDEWGNVDQLLAREILKERGHEVSLEVINELKKERINDLVQPETAPRALVYAGYIAGVLSFFFGLLGIFVGLILGWTLIYSKKTLPDGQSVHIYHEKDRSHGTLILVISLVSLAFLFVNRFLIA